jgi:diacylglycerol O-acyltransferase
MSDLEALMWTLEKDPHLSSTFANVTIFDRPPDVARLRARMQRALHAVPRLRQRVVPSVARLAPPEWRVDPGVDLDWHVRSIALPAPGTERQLFDLAAVLCAEPFDRARPLWRFTVIEGLEGGRAAMVQQIHHTITDGEGGVRMSVQFIDFERDAPDPEPLPVPDPPAAATAADDDDDHAPPSPGGSFVDDAADSLGHLLRRGLGMAQRTVTEAAGMARHPDRAVALASGSGATVQSLLRQAAVTDSAHSPLWTERSLGRRLDVLRVPLEEARKVAKDLDGSVNDLFVTAVAGGAGTYHRERGHDVEELRMAMPISTRDTKSAGGNSFMPTRTIVSTVADPRARFAAVRDRLAVTKTERSLRFVQSVAGLTNLLPTSVLVRTARQQVETVDFTTSNVRGAPFDLFIAGAHIDANYPLGPVAGTAFNATTLSVAGSLDIGVHTDTAAVDDPSALRDAIQASFDELLALGARPRRRSRPSG